jgi:hypothetical protein
MKFAIVIKDKKPRIIFLISIILGLYYYFLLKTACRKNYHITFRLIRDVAGTGTEFSRQDRKCFGNRTAGEQKTSNARG